MPGAGEGKEEPGLTREEQQVTRLSFKIKSDLTSMYLAGAGETAQGGAACG